MVVIGDTSTYQPGPGISITEMETLRAYVPDWPMHTPATTVENFVYDERQPEICYVYPPSDGNSCVEIMYGVKPVDCATVSDALSIRDNYANALLYLTLARAFSYDVENQHPQRAEAYYNLAREELGLKEAVDLKYSPNTVLQGGIPQGAK